MFAGIGGFRSGLEAIGGFECVGYCEIDKYAKQAYDAIYDTGGELYFDDARKIVSEQLPDFDLLVGEFPCQSFSIAGARKGFDDTRGTVKFVDSMGTIFPEWDNGRSLGVVPSEDSFRKLTQEEIETENQSESQVDDEVPDENSGITMGM